MDPMGHGSGSWVMGQTMMGHIGHRSKVLTHG